MTTESESRHPPGTHKLPRGFARLWAGETLSSTGIQITATAIPIIVIAELGASAAQVTLLSMAESIAVILFGFLGGSAADLADRRRLLIGLDLARAAAIMVIPTAFYFGFDSLALILAVVFMTAGLGVLFDSAMSGYIRDVVPAPLLVRANGYMQATQSTGEGGGPSLAGALVAIVTAPIAIAVDGVEYTIDLEQEESREFQKKLNFHLGHATRVGGRKRLAAVARPADANALGPKQIGQWAIEAG